MDLFDIQNDDKLPSVNHAWYTVSDVMVWLIQYIIIHALLIKLIDRPRPWNIEM